jgi:hypothetical protein
MATQSLLTLHPGRVLLEEFLAPKGISAWRLAKDIGVPVRRVYESSKANGRSMPISRIGCRITSACRSATGSIFRRGMISDWKKIHIRDVPAVHALVVVK